MDAVVHQHLLYRLDHVRVQHRRQDLRRHVHEKGLDAARGVGLRLLDGAGADDDRATGPTLDAADQPLHVLLRLDRVDVLGLDPAVRAGETPVARNRVSAE